MADVNMADYVKRSDWQLQNKLIEANCAKKLSLSGGNVSGKLQASELKAGGLSVDFTKVRNVKPDQICSRSVELLDETPFMYEIVAKTNQLAREYGVRVPQLPNRPQSKTQFSLVVSNVKSVAAAAGLEETAASLGDDPSVAQLARALNQAATAFGSSSVVNSESLQQSLSALGDAIGSFRSDVENANLLALDIDAKLDVLQKTKQDRGEYLSEKQLAKRFLDREAGGTVSGDVVLAGRSAAAELSAARLDVDFSKLINSTERRELSRYVLHLQGETLTELQSKCNEMIAYAELPLQKILPLDTAAADFGRAETAKRISSICRLAGVEGAGVDPSNEDMRLALNRALRKLTVFGSGLSLQTILQNYQTRNLLLEDMVGHCQTQLVASEMSASSRIADLETENAKLRAQVEDLRQTVEIAVSQMHSDSAAMLDGLKKNIEITPTKAQFATLSAELAKLQRQVASFTQV